MYHKILLRSHKSTKVGCEKKVLRQVVQEWLHSSSQFEATFCFHYAAVFGKKHMAVLPISHPPYLSNLALCNFCFFSSWKINEGVKILRDREDSIKSWTVLNTFTTKYFQDGLCSGIGVWTPNRNFKGESGRWGNDLTIFSVIFWEHLHSTSFTTVMILKYKNYNAGNNNRWIQHTRKILNLNILNLIPVLNTKNKCINQHSLFNIPAVLFPGRTLSFAWTASVWMCFLILCQDVSFWGSTITTTWCTVSGTASSPLRSTHVGKYINFS